MLTEADKVEGTIDLMGIIGSELLIHCNIGLPSMGDMSYSQNVSWFYASSETESPVSVEKTVIECEITDTGLVFGGLLTLKVFKETESGIYACKGVTMFKQILVHSSTVLKPGETEAMIL